MFKKSENELMVEEEINDVLKELKCISSSTEEYVVVIENLERLYSIKSKKAELRLKPDTIAIIAANLVGIALILGYEQGHVITTKAIGFVTKGRV